MAAGVQGRVTSDWEGRNNGSGHVRLAVDTGVGTDEVWPEVVLWVARRPDTLSERLKRGPSGWACGGGCGM